MLSTNTSEETEQVEWNYYLWQCVLTHPTMRPSGKKQTEGCGHWNLRKTKKDLAVNTAQSRCMNPDCTVKGGRRKRLTKKNVYLRLFTDEQHAKDMQNALNGGA